MILQNHREKCGRVGRKHASLGLTMFSSTNVEHRPKTMATNVVTTIVKLVEAALQ